MRQVIRQKFCTARLVFEFHALHPDSSPAATASVNRLSVHLLHVAELESEQQRQQDQARSAMEERQHAEAELFSRLEQLVRLCRVVAQQARVSELHLPLRLSGATTTNRLLAAGEAIRLASVHAPVLQHFGLPTALPTEMERWLAAIYSADERRRAALEASTALTPAIEQAVEAAAVTVRHLDALNRIRFARDPEQLQRWVEVRRGGESRQPSAVSAQSLAMGM